MVQAVLDINITFEHIPGKLNVLADALSRTHLDPTYYHTVLKYMKNFGLSYINPCLHFLSHTVIHSRSGRILASPEGADKTDGGEGPRNTGKSDISGQDIHRVLTTSGYGPTQPHAAHAVRVPGVPGAPHRSTSINHQPHVPYKNVHQTGRGERTANAAYPGTTGAGGHAKEQGVPVEQKTANPSGKAACCAGLPPGHSYRQCCKSSSTAVILRGPQAIGDRPTISQKVQPYQPPHTRRHLHYWRETSSDGKMGKELTAGWKGKGSASAASSNPGCVPNKSRQDSTCTNPHQAWQGAHVYVQRQSANPSHSDKTYMGTRTQEHWRAQGHIHTAQYSKNSSYTSCRAGLYRDTSAEVRGMEVGCI